MDENWCLETYEPSAVSQEIDAEGEEDQDYFPGSEDEEDFGKTAGQERRQTAQDAMLSEKERKAGVRAPRKVAEVEEDHRNKTLLEVGESYHREELAMRVKEHAVLRQIPCKQGARESLRIEYECQHCEKIAKKSAQPEEQKKVYKVVATFCSETGMMKLTRFDEHTCGYTCRDNERVCYSAKQLARIDDLRAVIKKNRRASAAQLRAEAMPFVLKPLTNNMVKNVRMELQAAVYGTEEEELPKLGQYAAFLRKEGHEVQAISASRLELIDIAMEYQKSKYEREQKRDAGSNEASQNPTIPWKDREPQVRAMFEELFSQHDTHAKYLRAVSIGFRAGKCMLPDLIPVLFSDASHMKGTDIGAVIYSTIAIDANHHIVPIVITYCVGNEGKEGWDIHISFLFRYLESNNFTVIMDGFLAAKRLLKRLGFSVFMCSEHFRKNIKNAVFEEFFLKALHASSPQRLAAIQADPRAANFFSRILLQHKDSELFLAASGKTYGQHSQSSVESWNAMLLPARWSFHPIGETCIYTCVHVCVCVCFCVMCA